MMQGSKSMAEIKQFSINCYMKLSKMMKKFRLSFLIKVVFLVRRASKSLHAWKLAQWELYQLSMHSIPPSKLYHILLMRDS